MAVIEDKKNPRARDVSFACSCSSADKTPLKRWRSRCGALAQASSRHVARLGIDPRRFKDPRAERFAAFLRELNITQPKSGTATSKEEARVVAADIGFPVVVRPSYVLGGRAMADRVRFDIGDARSLA